MAYYKAGFLLGQVIGVGVKVLVVVFVVLSIAVAVQSALRFLRGERKMTR